VLMAVAVAAAGHLAGRIDRRAPLLVAALALAVWVPATNIDIRAHSIPNEDVLSQITYLEAHFRPRDVVIVSYGASFGFAYYYPATPSFPVDTATPDGYGVAYPQLPWIVVMAQGNPVDVTNALAAAKNKIAAEPASARGRIWIIRSHQTSLQVSTWRTELAGAPVETIRVGPEPILLYRYRPR
jgi:hypothetical protein